jgi:hypothetical protein
MKWFSFLLFFTVSVMGYNYVAQAGLKLRTHSVLQTRLEHAIFFFFFWCSWGVWTQDLNFL